jgi:hypothetical protein
MQTTTKNMFLNGNKKPGPVCHFSRERVIEGLDARHGQNANREIFSSEVVGGG